MFPLDHLPMQVSNEVKSWCLTNLEYIPLCFYDTDEEKAKFVFRDDSDACLFRLRFDQWRAITEVCPSLFKSK